MWFETYDVELETHDYVVVRSRVGNVLKLHVKLCIQKDVGAFATVFVIDYSRPRHLLPLGDKIYRWFQE